MVYLFGPKVALRYKTLGGAMDAETGDDSTDDRRHDIIFTLHEGYLFNIRLCLRSSILLCGWRGRQSVGELFLAPLMRAMTEQPTITLRCIHWFRVSLDAKRKWFASEDQTSINSESPSHHLTSRTSTGLD